MLTKKSLLMKVYMSFIIVIAFTITSCAQEQKKTEQTSLNDQTKTVAIQKQKMSVGGMSCSACQASVKKAIKSLDGVTDVEVNLEKKFAFFSYDPLKIKPEQIRNAVNDIGYIAGKPEDVKQ